MRRLRSIALVAVAMLVPMACGDDVPPATESAQQSTAAAESMLTAEGFPCRTLTVREADTISTHCVWAATTSSLRERGLMGIADPELGGRGAMVFVFPGATTASFWMKDTIQPLTVVWVDSSGKVLGSTDMVPCTATDAAECAKYPPPGPYQMAIEVAQGRAPQWGLVPGATVTLGDPC